jgi:hypothetical protein
MRRSFEALAWFRERQEYVCESPSAELFDALHGLLEAMRQIDSRLQADVDAGFRWLEEERRREMRSLMRGGSGVPPAARTGLP